jgi:hypothetical protein
MAGKIFINYRRDDSIGTAGRLNDRLAQSFGRNNLFMDVDNIPAGVDFVEYLSSQVAACDVFLAIIGPNWLDAKDDDGRRRLDNPDDYVAIEIAAALARKIRVIPVLVDGARTPKADKLPDSVKPLVRRNAAEIRNTQFGRDAEALAMKVREALEGARPVTQHRQFLATAAAWFTAPGRWRAKTASATALLLAGWVGLYQLGVPVWVPWGRDPPRTDKANVAADTEAQRKAQEAEQQRLREEVQRQTKRASDAEAKLKATEAEQQRSAADAEAKRKAAEVEQQRLPVGDQGLFSVTARAAVNGEEYRIIRGLSAVERCLDECAKDRDARCLPIGTVRFAIYSTKASAPTQTLRLWLAYISRDNPISRKRSYQTAALLRFPQMRAVSFSRRNAVIDW